ncbi:MAG: M42 family metallopeptidase [Candidatus Aenigmatarchaeota archaeon]
MGLLERLIETYGVSGNEKNVRKLIEKEIKSYVDKIFVDKLGNLIAYKKGKSPKVMLAAHMDEIGLMTKFIDQKGRIFCSLIGGIDPITLVGEIVNIEAKKGLVRGVITTKNINDGYIVEELPKEEGLIIDTGLTKRELRAKGVEVGNYISIEQPIYLLGSNDIICGKAFDDRIGCYILIELAKRLKNKSKNEIYFVFTIQEEIGLFGAITSAYKIEPDWAIVVDVTAVDDASIHPTKTIGKGPCITVKDSDMLGNTCINDWIKKIAHKKKIHYQLDISEFGTTEAVSISISKGGVPATAIGVPIRNLHTATAVASKKDIENTIKLLEEIMKRAPTECLIE